MLQYPYGHVLDTNGWRSPSNSHSHLVCR